MKRLTALLLTAACLAATPVNIVKESDNLTTGTYGIPTRSVTCPYCGTVYMDSDLYAINPHLRYQFSSDEGTWETCNVRYIRALVHLTGAKRIEEPK
jgi:hypothetical protein